MGHENAVDKKRLPNPVTQVQRPLNHGAKFYKMWYPSSEFDGTRQRDLVMYHPAYTGPKVADIAQGQVLFYPPENEEWIIAQSDKQQGEPKPKKKNKNKTNAQIDADPFDVRYMRPYADTKEGTRPPADSASQPTSNNN